MAVSESQEQGQVIKPGSVNAPEFPEGLDWFNVDHPLRMHELRGKIVLLDFWTHCCINCMHVIDELKLLEKKYSEVLVVIGVHSAKFTTEKNTRSIAQAILRNGIEHPVVNDHAMQIWQEYAVRAWPSFMLIDPKGKVLGTHSGERVFDLFDGVISQMIDHYDNLGEIERNALTIDVSPQWTPATLLSFPGKVLADAEGGRLFIADTNHNRIIVADMEDGKVLQVLGSGKAGLKDGAASNARFLKPQGMALSEETLYIADTGNHAVRQVDLAASTVSTLIGDGQQDTEWESQPTPLEGKRLNSPWDLELAHGVLFVAMAGNHQIYGIDLEGGYIATHAGSGREDHVDGPLLAAALAQPSGLSSNDEDLFVADSEVSSIRAVALDPRGGHVKTVVGKGLFDFGDQDGTGKDVRLQHPIGVVFAENRIFVADTFNHKIKSIDLQTLQAVAVAGSDQAGLQDSIGENARFHEPSGLSYADGKLYIADCNNHVIRIMDIRTAEVNTWNLKDIAKLIPELEETLVLDQQIIKPGEVKLRIKVDLPVDCEFNPQAESGLILSIEDRMIPMPFEDGTAELTLDITDSTQIELKTMVYFCSAELDEVCLFYHSNLEVPLQVDSTGCSEVYLALTVENSTVTTG